MTHTNNNAREEHRRVLANLAKRLGATLSNNGRLYFNTKNSFNNNNSRAKALMRQARPPPTRILGLLNELNKKKKKQYNDEAAAFRRMLAIVRASLNPVGRKFY